MRSTRQQAAGYPSVFAHGMLTMGLTGKMLTNYVGDGRLTKFGVRFTNQVWPGDTLDTTATVAAIREEGGQHYRRSDAVHHQPGRQGSRLRIGNGAHRPVTRPMAAEAAPRPSVCSDCDGTNGGMRALRLHAIAPSSGPRPPASTPAEPRATGPPWRSCGRCPGGHADGVRHPGDGHASGTRAVAVIRSGGRPAGAEPGRVGRPRGGAPRDRW